MQQQTYIIAVSGGVDSMVLLHMLQATNNPKVHYVVAHFNHGIRSDAHEDAALVQRVAALYGFETVIGEGALGSGVSEATAREARYKFLRQVAAQHGAQAIITAHHQDDLLETMVLSIFRRNGVRSLLPMQGQQDIVRPLLQKTKQEILAYAQAHHIEWREDSTNADTTYLRNYVRAHIMPKLEPARAALLTLHEGAQNRFTELDFRLRTLTPTSRRLYRPGFVVLPYCVQKEVVRAWLLRVGTVEVTAANIEHVTLATKTLAYNKKIDVDGTHWLVSKKDYVYLLNKNDDVPTV